MTYQLACYSLQFPLHYSLIVSTDAEEPLAKIASTEFDSNNMFGVTSVASGDAALSTWVSEYIDKSVVITSCN